MSKSHVGMGYEVCPVCGQKHTETVLLDTELKESLERETCTGFSLCEEHRKLFEQGYIALIELDKRPTNSDTTGLEFNNRTGRFAHVKKEIWPNLFSSDCPKTSIAFIDKEVMDFLEKESAQSRGITEEAVACAGLN